MANGNEWSRNREVWLSSHGSCYSGRTNTNPIEKEDNLKSKAFEDFILGATIKLHEALDSQLLNYSNS
jgi:hypothetical protein